MSYKTVKTALAAAAGIALANTALAETDTTTIGVHTTVEAACVLHDDNTSTTHTTRVVDFGAYTNDGTTTYSTTATDDYESGTGGAGYAGGSMAGASLPTNSGTALPAVVVSCGLATPYTLRIDYGNQPDGSNQRFMASEQAAAVTTDTISYDLSCAAVDTAALGAAFTAAGAVFTALGITNPFDISECSDADGWGNEANNDFAGTGLGETVLIPVPLSAEIPSGQGEKFPGSYGDIVTVTLEF